MIVRKAYKSRIKVSQTQKIILNHNIFIINQVYNFLIEKLNNSRFQSELINLEYAKLINQTALKSKKITKKLVITNKGKIRNLLLPLLIDYFDKRKISIKGLSKPIQLKVEDFLDTFNKINLSKNNHNYKFSSNKSFGGFKTDSSIKLIKKKYKTSNGKNKTKYFIKIGKEIFLFKNNKLNIKRFDLKQISLTRKDDKYYISLSGKEIIPKLILNKNSNIGIDVNFEKIVLSNSNEYITNNFQLKLNLYTKKFNKLKIMKSKRIELNRKVLKTLCDTKKISIYDKRMVQKKKFTLTKRAKKLFKEILSKDVELNLIKKRINKIYSKRVNLQEDFFKKLSNELTSKYDFCFIEKLNIENMVNKDVDNQNLYNASMGKFLTILRNKASTSGKSYIEVNSFNTSKECSNCKNINENLKVFEKKWECSECNEIHDRDYNAAKNIQKLGITKLREVSIN